MAEKGYGPDQVVAYAVDGVSRYVVCWTRNPDSTRQRGSPNGRSSRSTSSSNSSWSSTTFRKRPWLSTATAGLALSRGFGHADVNTQPPVSPAAVMPLGDLSIRFAAAAVHSLIRKQKLTEDSRVSDLLGSVHGGAAAKPRPTAPGSEQPLTLGRLLGGLDDSAPQFEGPEVKGLIALAAGTTDLPAGPVPLTDLDLQGVLLGRILETATGKPVSQAIAAELGQALRLTPPVSAASPIRKPEGVVSLSASAVEVGRFFLKNQFDGRPLPPRAKPCPGFVIGRRGPSLAIIQRRDDVLVVALTLPEDAPLELADMLRTRLDDAIASLPPTSAIPGKRKSSPR